MELHIKYDIALSFAGEDRIYVKEVAKILKLSEVNVFYDEFEEFELWGKNLYTYLGEIYKNRAKYTIIFCSKHYNSKLWANHERENAQERAFRENSEYILPAKLDDTEIPGIKNTIAYIDLRKKTPYEFCEIICKKLKVNIVKKNVLDEREHDNENIKSYLIDKDSTINFSNRFAAAFPGLRGIKWFDDKSAIEMRLIKLLEKPLSHNGYNPIWWWRDGNLQIERFTKTGDNLFLMNNHELLIEKIAAVNILNYYQQFVYVETLAMPATGLYNDTNKFLSITQKELGYHYEEYGLYYNKHFITRAEYDDGAALIDGKLIDFNSNIELRRRYLTPYNFIIAAHNSPINNNSFDTILKNYLNLILERKSTLDDLVEMVLRLPKK